MGQLRISEDVRGILSASTIDSMTIFLPPKQLDRKRYEQVNKILEAMGGKWNKKTKGHVFNFDPTDRLDEVLLTGQINNPKTIKNGYFPTPLPIVRRLIELADIRPGMSVLEPSAGQGHIADELRKLDCELSVVEILPENQKVLASKGYKLWHDDFLDLRGTRYDRIVMNPPFEKQQDIDHVLHAFDYMIGDRGKIVSVMSSGVLFRENRKTHGFRELIERNGSWERNPEGSFKASGTMVDTIIVTLEK